MIKNFLLSPITEHLSNLKEQRSNKSYNSRLSRWVDRLLPYQFKVEHLPGAKMGLVHYISRKPYQPAKSISKVATLSSIHSDAKLLQQKHNISAHTLTKLYHDNECEIQNSTKYTEQVLNIDYAKPKSQTKVNKPLAPQNHSLKPFLNKNFNFDSDPAERVRLTNYNSALATRKYHSTLSSFEINNQHSEHASRVRLTQNIKSLADQIYYPDFSQTNCMKFTSAHAKRVHLTQNQLVFAQSCHTRKVNTPKYTNSNPDFAARVRFSHNKLTPAGQNTLLSDQQNISHNSKASFAMHVNNFQNRSQSASHSLPIVITPLQIESQINSNTGKASLAYQNKPQFTQISHSHLSITNRSQIPTFFSTPNSHILNYSRDQLTNKKKSLFAQIQPEIQLSSSLSINLIEKTKTSSKMSQQASHMKGKSATTRANRALPRVSFTDNPTTNTPR